LAVFFIYQMNRVNSRNGDSTINIVLELLLLLYKFVVFSCNKFHVLSALLYLVLIVRNLQRRLSETDVRKCRRWWLVADKSWPARHRRVLSCWTKYWPTQEVVLLIVVTFASNFASWHLVCASAGCQCVISVVKLSTMLLPILMFALPQFVACTYVVCLRFWDCWCFAFHWEAACVAVRC